MNYGSVRIATGTMGYKHRALDTAVEAGKLAAPNFLLKIIPHVDGTPRLCELVRYHLEDITVKGARTGPAALDLYSHALAPVAELLETERSAVTSRTESKPSTWTRVKSGDFVQEMFSPIVGS